MCVEENFKVEKLFNALPHMVAHHSITEIMHPSDSRANSAHAGSFQKKSIGLFYVWLYVAVSVSSSLPESHTFAVKSDARTDDSQCPAIRSESVNTI